MRVGHGVDVHRFSTTGPIVLLGEVVDDIRGVSATSDGDVAAHALADALLGAAALGDIGMLAPSDAPESANLDSMRLLGRVGELVRDAGFSIGNVDITVIAQTIRVSPHRDAMRRNVADTLGIPLERVSVKATTTDGLGLFGRDEGLGALATAVVAPQVE